MNPDVQRMVGIIQQGICAYPIVPPYHPPKGFPELQQFSQNDDTNAVYGTVRELFRHLKYDEPNLGATDWNPLRWLINPGETVFIKPNMISHKHRLTDEWEHVITHGSVVRAVLDYVYLALNGRGTIIIGDAPQTDSDMPLIQQRMGLLAIRDYYRSEFGFQIELVDLRDVHHIDEDGIYTGTNRLPGDPRGAVAVDLSDASVFSELDAEKKRYYGAYYDWKETNEHQRMGRHEYAISRSAIEADVFINIPKLKTHKKCGITVNLKSLVGINANKNLLPHYAFGSPESGGDQFPTRSVKATIENLLVLPSKRLLLKNLPLFKAFARRTKQVGYNVFGGTEQVIRSGNWHGNDTVWRMCLDLNRILMYAQPDGEMRDSEGRKRYLSVVDGIVAMEGNGPVAGTRKETGVILGGANAVAVDTVAARLMGFDPSKLSIVKRSFDSHRYPLVQFAMDEIWTVSNNTAWQKALSEWRLADTFRLKPHFGWVGTVEAAD